MISQVNLAAMLAAAGGILQGSFALPLKRMERWKWENTWLIYSIVGLLILPFCLAYITVPSWREVYSVAPAWNIAVVVLFGFGWGLGSTLYALGVSRIGMAMAFAVIFGLSSSFGSLVPFLVQTPADLLTRRGVMLLVSLVLVIAGIVLLATARSERDRNRGGGTERLDPADLRNGMIFSTASGILLPMLNFSFAFGKPVQDAAVVVGARPDLAANAVWAPALAAGFLPNALYSIYLLSRKKTWGKYVAEDGAVFHFLGASAMGLLWFGGTCLYGVGAATMGAPGAVVGWPIFVTMNVIMMSLLGVLTGEWSGAGSKARVLSWAGTGVLVVAMIVVALAGQA